MLRRQALGDIKINSNSNNNLNGLAAKASQNGKMLAKNPILSQMQFNDENEPLQFALSSFESQSSSSCAATTTMTKSEFAIFQEEQLSLQKQNNVVVEPVAAKLPGPSASIGNSNKENYLFKSEVDDDDENEEDEDEEDEEEEDEDYEEEEESDEDEEDEDEDEDDEEEGDDDDDEEDDDENGEDGISRLNLAALDAESNLELMMDSTSSTNFSASPMVLDDTIRFMSQLDDSGKGNNTSNFFEDDEEEDLLTKRRLASENTLFNLVDYKDDCLKYMRKLEQDLRPKTNYMKKQVDISTSMRSILVDWLVEVAEEYKLCPETLHLAVNYTDRFLSQMSVLRGKLQLVGTACMYIAAKYEEITPPDVNEFVYITDDTYSRKQVLRMEHLLLKTLDFRMSQPTANWFLTTYLKNIQLGTNLNQSNNSDLFHRIEFLSRYLIELTILDGDIFLPFLPSQIAASALYLALLTCNRSWTKQMADLIGHSYELSECKACVVEMFKFYQNAGSYPQQAIQLKYKQAKYEHVSLIEAPKALPAFLQPTVANV